MLIAPTPMIIRSLRHWLAVLGCCCCLFPAVLAQGSGDLPSTPKGKARPARPKPTPPPKAVEPVKEAAKPAVVTRREPASTPPIAFNQNASASLDPEKSGQISAGNYYDEYLLTATSGDIFTIQLQTADPSLSVQVFDQDRAGLPILKDPRTSEFRLGTPGGTLPGDGEYRVRVLGVIPDPKTGPVGYTLKVNRTGLTDAGYQARLQEIVAAFNSPETKNVEEAIGRLEQLSRDDPPRPGAYEMLGVIYLYHQPNLEKAAGLMEQAIKLNGAATFKVTHDTALGRRPVKKPDGQFDWVEPRAAWLKIRNDQVSLGDAENAQQVVFSLSGQQVKELTLTRVSSLPLVSLKAHGQAKPYLINPGTKAQPESDLIMRLIRTHVIKKG